MKYAKIFTAFLLLHLMAWVAAHIYLQANVSPVLVVVDTSFSMKEKFPQVKNWIEDFEKRSRYKKILIGTDKAMLGNLKDLQSTEVIFRTSFGKLQESNLNRHYGQTKAREKILLSDIDHSLPGWELVTFK